MLPSKVTPNGLLSCQDFLLAGRVSLPHHHSSPHAVRHCTLRYEVSYLGQELSQVLAVKYLELVLSCPADSSHLSF